MMSDSEDENVLYAPTGQDIHQAEGLLGSGVKNVNDILNGPADNRKLQKTLALCGAFIGLGLAIAVLGPTLKELESHLNVDLPHVSYIFTGRSIGYVIGSILGGVTFEHFHPLMLIAITLAMSGIGLLATPYCHQLLASIISIAFVGIAMGALDTGANVVCLRMWGKKSSPFMQSLHFSFALGAFIAPLLAGPFISDTNHLLIESSAVATTLATPESEQNITQHLGQPGYREIQNKTTTEAYNSTVSYPASTTNYTHSDTNLSGTEDDPHNASTDDQLSITPNIIVGGKKTSATPFQGVYVIIAVYLVLMAFVFTYFFCTSPYQLPSTVGHRAKQSTADNKPSDNHVTHFILGLLFLFYFLYVGAEVGYGGYIYTFATNNDTVTFHSENATRLNSLFWGTFALGRGVSICIASVISPLTMILLDMVGCIMSSLVLAYEANTNPLVLWVGTATLGLSMASLFPAGISWLESHAPVTSHMASFLIVGAALGEMTFPVLLGYLFQLDVGSMSLMYVMFLTSVLTAIIFAIAIYLAASTGKNFDPKPPDDMPAVQILQGVQESINMTDMSFTGSGQVSKPVLPRTKSHMA